MARYIDKDEALKKMWDSFDYQAILNIPTADVMEVKHGKWLDHQNGRWIYAKCSICGTIHDTKTNYCPNCGARMDEMSDDE